MENAYIRATLIQITNILLIFTMNPIMKCCQKSFSEFVLLPNSDEWYHMWLVTKPNLDFGKMWKYPYKWNYSAIGLSKISNQLIWYNSSEFGNNTNSLNNITLWSAPIVYSYIMGIHFGNTVNENKYGRTCNTYHYYL